MGDAANPAAGAAEAKVPPASIYGGGPGQGITLPPYFKPTASVVSASNFFPLLEELGPDEMRISFAGTCPFPPKRNQAATCIMVELGNGQRLFFDFGPGCLRNIAAFQVPVQDVNDIFITHLHVDHYGELPYLYAFAPWAARWTPLRVYGPSGRRPDEGIAAMIDGMKQMTRWHTTGFACGAVGDGYEVEVSEFDYEDDNGICYDKNGVTVRHWRRSHNMDGASAYRLDWSGLSFVWTGDGRPDTLTAKYAQGADVFVTELQPDLGKLMEQKTGIPQQIYNATIDMVHTDHYATGYVINQVQPRLGMVTHMAYDHEVVNEAIAGVREHWKGLFVLGAPDGVVINVTKDAIWARAAVLPDSGNFKKPASDAEFRQMFGGQVPETMRIPEPRHTREELLSPGVRAIEIPPSEFVPADVLRPLITDMGKAFGPAMGKDIPVQFLFGAKGLSSVAGELTHALRDLASALNLLAGGIVGQALPDSTPKDQIKAQLGAVADMALQVTRQSDSIREASSAAAAGAARSMQDEAKRGDLKTAAAALVDVAKTITGQLRQPGVRDQAKQAAGLLIDGLAGQLGSPDVQSGSADPTATLKTALAMSQVLAAGIFGQVLRDPSTAQQGQQACALLARFVSSSMAGHDGTPALADALRLIGRMLQDPQQLDAVKSAAGVLIEVGASVGGKLQDPDTRSALKGGTGLLIDSLGRQMTGLNDKSSFQEDVALSPRVPEVSAARETDGRSKPMTTKQNEHLSLAERLARGEEARDRAPLTAHGEWRPAGDRPDPVKLLEEQNATREPDLVPVRHGRMMVSPFTFYRGAAKIMAADLAGTPTAGLSVQLCGDAHLSNFGLFASPERMLLFDVNDFDETLPGPFEYDVKRLAASFTIASRNNGFSEASARKVTMTCVAAYREAMVGFAGMRTMDVWYARLDEDELQTAIHRAARQVAKDKNKAAKQPAKGKKTAQEAKKLEKRSTKTALKAHTRDSLQALSKLGEMADGRYRIVSMPPVVVPFRELHEMYGISPDQLQEIITHQFREYRATLQPDRRRLLERFEIVDMARKVVGVGSVGTRAFIALLEGRDEGDPLFLQIKEATASVLEDHLPKSRYRQPGERVVQGQRLMQASSDIFLGWAKGEQANRYFYWRQLRDMKGSAEVETMPPEALAFYARICGWTLARAHARSGDPAAIAAYLGTSDQFDTSITGFSQRYADQNEQDYQAFTDAVRSGRIAAHEGV